MKKLILSFAVALLCVPTTAQQYIIINNETPILVSDVDKITYEQDEQFSSHLLPAVLAADPKARLFSGALQETGMTEMLCNYEYEYYPPKENYSIMTGTWEPIVYYYNTNRNKMFTMFVETDDVLAAQGINNIDDLKAYAKKVYDAVYPEDADISNPKDSRNSLNRFVAYHILPFGCNYWNLTYYDGKQTDKVIDTDMTDIAAWYGTHLSHASLKCSYPMGAESGIYLNHRGLKDGPDKYGKQIRGAKVVSGDSNDSDPFTHQAFNGYYFYIDRILAYDKATQDDVLGSELWRVDFKALSPDIMNNAEELRGNFLVYDDNHPEDARNGRNYAYDWNCLENITAENMNAPLLIHRAVCYYPTYLCDIVSLPGDGGSITIKLPPLPAGEWEIRMGTNTQSYRPTLKVYLNDQVAIESLDLTQIYDESDFPKKMKAPVECRFNNGGSGNWASISEYYDNVRYPLGRITTDGKSDNYLRIECLSDGEKGDRYNLDLDYFEFVPKPIYDNE